jgi:hypothetical protein
VKFTLKAFLIDDFQESSPHFPVDLKDGALDAITFFFE